MSIAEDIDWHAHNRGLVSFEVHESLNGWQAIAKYRHCVSGPWGVGCDVDLIAAIEQALVAGARITNTRYFWHPESETLMKTDGADMRSDTDTVEEIDEETFHRLRRERAKPEPAPLPDDMFADLLG